MSDNPFNVQDLRQVLSDEIRKIQTGQTTAANVNAISNAAGKILGTVKLQLEYAKLTGKPLPEISLLSDGATPDPANR